MATIISQGPTIDGYDVRILTAGETHVLHFAAPPSDGAVLDAITAFESRLMDAAISEREEGDYAIFDQ